jgi:hypothetical protein
VDKLISTAKNVERIKIFTIGLQRELRRKVLPEKMRKELNQLIKEFRNLDIAISNWTSFLSYNLERWQIIPFFVSDNEGGIRYFLEAEKPIRFDNTNYNVPPKWKFLWGIDNKNHPFAGSSLELANFSDDELTKAISTVLRRQIRKSLIGRVRIADSGINEVDKEVKINKIEIVNLLVTNLLNSYKGKEKEMLERPIFKVVERITDLAVHNHPPVDTIIEMENKEFIIKELMDVQDVG